MKRSLFSLALALACIPAFAAPLTFTNEGVVGQTTIFKAGLGGLGLPQIGSLSIVDSNSGVGGSPGVFSGFDLDFVFIDIDGVFATTGDRIFATTFLFTTGTIRPTLDPSFQPTATRPGPTFGSSAADTIDHALATLDTRDGSFPAVFNTDNVFGWLSLGDGGSLLAGLASPLLLTGTEALFLGEVGTDVGELVNATVTVSEQRIPEPGSATLLVLSLLALAFSMRSPMMLRAYTRRRVGRVSA